MTSIVHAKFKFTKVSVPAEWSKRILNQVSKSKASQDRSNGRWGTNDPTLSI
jgi:hypothetical protein